MKEKKERRTKCNKQEIGLSFFRLQLKKKSNSQILLESCICKNLNLAKSRK